MRKKDQKEQKEIFFVFSLVLEGLDSCLSQVFQKLEIFINGCPSGQWLELKSQEDVPRGLAVQSLRFHYLCKVFELLSAHANNFG